MAYVAPTLENLQAKLKKYFELAGFTNIAPGTPEHALYNMMADNMYELYTSLQASYDGVLPLNAEGETLDLWASFFNMNRGTAIYAEDTSLTNVHFIITESNRQVLNGGSDFVIPAGTELSVDGLRRYVTLEDTTMPAYNSPPYIAYAPVRSAVIGTYNNIDVGELNTHNLLDQFPDIDGIDLIEVSNKFPIQSGAFQQLDSDLQIDIQNVFGKNITTNLEAMLQRVNALPGVANADVLEAVRGTGTFSIFIDSTSPIIPMSLVNQVQMLIDAEKPVGSKGYVEYPDYKAITMQFEILPKSGESGDEVMADLSGTETENIITIINNIGRGQPLNPDNLLRVVLDNDKVNNAIIKELKIGSYSIIEDKVLNSEFTVSSGLKELEWNQKWFGSSSLISYCLANG